MPYNSVADKSDTNLWEEGWTKLTRAGSILSTPVDSIWYEVADEWQV